MFLMCAFGSLCVWIYMFLDAHGLNVDDIIGFRVLYMIWWMYFLLFCVILQLVLQLQLLLQFFFKSVANCVENMNNRRKIRHDRSSNCVEIIFRRKIRHDVSYNRVEMDFRRKVSQIFIFFL